jgi:hypothetical protein
VVTLSILYLQMFLKYSHLTSDLLNSICLSRCFCHLVSARPMAFSIIHLHGLGKKEIIIGSPGSGH